MKNYMKEGVNSIARLPFVFLFGLMCFIPLYFSSCSDSLDEREPQLQYGALEIASGGERALEIDKIKYAEVCVTGTNIKSPLKSEEIVSGGTGNITISNIPVGKNRIVTVYAKDSSASTIYGVTLRAVVDIKAGETAKVSVNWTTTALGNVFNELNLLGVDLQAVDSSKISNCIDPSKHALLINAAKIASDYKQNSLKSAADYVMTPATAKVNFTQAEGKFTVQVCDPISSVTTGVNGVTNVTNIAPGTWDVVLLDASGSEIKRKTLNTFTSGGTVDIDMNDKVWTDIVVHAKYTHIWAWNKNGVAGDLFAAWPGEKMTEETGGWYGYEIKDASSLKVIFSNAGNSQSPTKDIAKSGEYWYVNGELQESNPDKPVTPSVKFSKEGGTYLEGFEVAITSTNGSSDIIYYTIDGTEPTTSSNVYASPIKISTGTTTLKAFAVNAGADIPRGEVSAVTYKIDSNADLTAPEIKANKPTGRYKQALSDISFTITDNKSDGFTVYYTTDGTVPTTSSPVYITCASGAKTATGKNLSLAMNKNMTVRLLAVDKAGNENGPKAFYYACSDVSYSADRWDPRQESIYFLLTARWFDGDPDNTIGDMNCSWTEARANDSIPSSEDGFTGPEDVSWRGDFKGLVEKMDYIKSLGFTCIWLTPIVQNRSPLCYHGYHAWNMYKEDARLVSAGYDFQRVIDEAHARGMKICLDIVINHSGRFGLENFAEVKYNRNPANFPVPQGWENFKYDENAYQAAYNNSSYDYINSVSQNYPNGWRYDGLHSPGNYPAGWTMKIGSTTKDVGGTPIPAWADFVGDVRPFTQADKDTYGLSDVTLFNYPSTESYCKTIDDVGTPGSLTLAGYANSKRRIRGHNTGFPTGSGSFDNYPEANLDSLHEDCPDLNIENPAVQDYIVGAYNRYIDMGVDMFRVDTVMHMTKETLNDHYWNRFFEEAATSQAKEARGGADFFIFGEVGNFVNNLSDKPKELRQSNYVWDNTVSGPLAGSGASTNHLLDGNNYRTINKAHKAVPESDYVVSTIDIISHNGFCDGVGGAYGRALSNSDAYWDSTYLTWYTDSHDYGPNKGETRWKGDFAGAWSMLFTFRGIPIVYYGSEIRFAEGKPNDWPGGGGNGVNMSLEKTGRSYFGPHLEGSVTATDFGEYTASGEVKTTLNSELSKHLRDLNRIRLAIPALQMGQYSTEGHTGGWAGYKRRYTGTNKITGEAVDSYALVGVGAGTHSWTGVLAGDYVDIISGNTESANGGSISVAAHGSNDAALVVLVKTGLATPAPGKVAKESPYLGF